MSFLTPKSAPIGELPAAAPPPPKATDANVSTAYQDARRRAAQSSARANTVLTGPGGLANVPASTAPKSLLGV